MKFELIISNPPYNRGLDLKILNEIYDLTNKICFIHPSRWLINEKPSSHFSQKIKDFLHGNCYFEILNGYDYFPGTQINEGITISMFKTLLHDEININDLFYANESYKVDSFYDISKYGTCKSYKRIKDIILNYCKSKNNLLKMQNIKDGNHISSFSGIQNYTAIYAKYPGKSDFPIKFYFKTEVEKKNFEITNKTKLARFCVSIYKSGRHLDSGELASVPYMPTYEREWTDEDVAKELGLTDEELKWAINWIPDYYPEDKEKYGIYK